MVFSFLQAARGRQIGLTAAAALVALVGSGCDDERPPPFDPGDAGPIVVDGAPMGDAGTTLDAPPLDPEGPIVSVLDPVSPAAGDFSGAAILTETRFSVRCEALDSGSTPELVDSSSVRVQAVQGEAVIEVPALPTGVAGEFNAEIAIDAFGNGAMEIRCSASDTADPPRTNTASIATFLDKGPEVEIFVPDANGSYAQQLDVLFTVSPSPVAPGDDTLSAVDDASVALYLAGINIDTLVQMGNTFTTSIPFDDPLFGDPLIGQQNMSVLAANDRGVTRQIDTVFTVDSEGPVITVEEPLAGELVSGIMRLRVTVDDDVGVEPTSVIATVAGDHDVVLMPDMSGDEYIGFFDTRILVNMVFPTVVVRARDLLGNQSSFGLVIALDNVPPRITLDSPPVRGARYDTGILECSAAIDPLGSDAASDGQSLTQLSELRVRSEDRPNIAFSSTPVIVPRAGVEPDSVDMFVLDDSDGAIIVDMDGDGFCDDINPKLAPTSTPMADDEVARLDMVPLPPGGDPHFEGGLDYSGDPPANSECMAETSPGAPPSPLCDGQSPLTWLIPDPVGEPAIYTIPPVGGLQCLGNAFDSVATRISDGWACVTARSEDRLGNLNVAPPLRVCFDADLNGAEGCPPLGQTSMDPLPDCTGTYDPMTDTVDPAIDCTIPPADLFTAFGLRFY